MTGRIMADVASVSLTAEDAQFLAQPEVGAVILFGRNCQNAAQVTQLCAEIRAVRSDLLIAIDQEGGRVQRLRQGVTDLPALQKLGDIADPSVASRASYLHGWSMAVELLALGVDFSFAPVLDVDRDRCKAIGDRSFGDDPERVIVLGGAYLDGMRDAGMASTGKHFPGHGSVIADSHQELPQDLRTMEAVRAWDMRPFLALAKKLDGVMPAHLLFPEIDPQPVGFSPYWLQTVLRAELGFTGCIFSDDMNMAGAHWAGGPAERAELALNAGCDMVLMCNNRAAAQQIVDWMASQPPATSDRLDAMRARRAWTREQVLQHPLAHERATLFASL